MELVVTPRRASCGVCKRDVRVAVARFLAADVELAFCPRCDGLELKKGRKPK